FKCDWSSDVGSSDLDSRVPAVGGVDANNLVGSDEVEISGKQSAKGAGQGDLLKVGQVYGQRFLARRMNHEKASIGRKAHVQQFDVPFLQQAGEKEEKIVGPA